MRSAFISSIIYIAYICSLGYSCLNGDDGAGSGLFQGNIQVLRDPLFRSDHFGLSHTKGVCLRVMTGVERRYCWF